MITDAKPAVVGMVVADMERTLAFYRLLGLDIPAEADTQPHVEVALPGGLKLAFDTEATIASFHPSWKPTPGAGRVGLAFALPDPAAVDDAYAQLTAAGHQSELEPFDAFWGMRYATVLDPDGTGIDLFALLPGGEGAAG
jgi:catechol 2,3-dioxygenase-like lactoylglutathione lyase family enzyme